MEKRLFTQKDLEKKCAGLQKTDFVLCLACTALCLCLGIVFAHVLPEKMYLFLAFFAVALFFAVLTVLALRAGNAVRGGRYSIECGTVSKKHEKGICDTGAYSLQFTFTAGPVKKITAADLTLEEFRASAAGKAYYVFILNALRPKVLCIVPEEEYELAPELKEKLAR